MKNKCPHKSGIEVFKSLEIEGRYIHLCKRCGKLICVVSIIENTQMYDNGDEKELKKQQEKK